MSSATYKDQIIAGTRIDSQGERRPKEYFEELIKSFPARSPLNQQHDMRLETVGYLENFRVVQDTEDESEWNVIADVFLTKGDLDSALKGFSYSALEHLASNAPKPYVSVHLPYPLYNDEAYIRSLLDEVPGLLVGRWVKKAADPTTISLVAALIVLVVRPEWEIQYKENIRPAILKAIELIKGLREKGSSADLLQHVRGNIGEDVQLLFVPDRANEDASFSEAAIFSAVSAAIAFLQTDEKSKNVGVQRIRFYFDLGKRRYVLFHVQYLDGTDTHHA